MADERAAPGGDPGFMAPQPPPLGAEYPEGSLRFSRFALAPVLVRWSGFRAAGPAPDVKGGEMGLADGVGGFWEQAGGVGEFVQERRVVAAGAVSAVRASSSAVMAACWL
jgi:hypothetical protein